MSNTSLSAVKLLKTNKYQTYQFYGEMLSNTTKPEDGLKIAALSCLSWLRRRLEGNRIPECLVMPETEDYDKTKEEDYKSFNFSDDFIIDVAADMEEGIWALRVIENDLGALTDTEPVPGRTIQSDIAFRIIDKKLQCAFKTMISDKENVPKASCVRFSLIKELSNNSLFGLKQIINIYDPEHIDIKDENRLNEIYCLYNENDNQLPILMYCYDDFFQEDGSIPMIGNPDALIEIQQESIRKNVLSRAEPYTNRYTGIARPYFLPKRWFKKATELFKLPDLFADDVVVIEPKRYGGKIKLYKYNDKDSYCDYVGNFTRDRQVDFKDVLFVDEAKVIIDRKGDDYISDILAQLDETTKNLEAIRNKINRSERINNYQKTAVVDHNEELEDALKQLQKSENDNLVLAKEINRLKVENRKMNDYIVYVKRKQERPVKHADIAQWTNDFRYISLDKKAVDCLNRNDAENVDINVICDALDYLEYLYSQYLFEGMSEEELNDRSAQIYNRPFEVSKSGIPVSARGDCKIKYAFADGVRREYPLDWHLKAGNHGELIRIYFIIDRDRKKMIIGSLPNHLIYNKLK